MRSSFSNILRLQYTLEEELNCHRRKEINNFSLGRIIACIRSTIATCFQCFSHVNIIKRDAPQTAIFFCHRHGCSVICDWMMTKSAEIARVFRANRALAYEGERMRNKATGQHSGEPEGESVSLAGDKARRRALLFLLTNNEAAIKMIHVPRVFLAPINMHIAVHLCHRRCTLLSIVRNLRRWRATTAITRGSAALKNRSVDAQRVGDP